MTVSKEPVTRRGWDAIRGPFLITLGITIALILRVAMVWSELPETMASHFGAGGRPNDYMSKVPFFWFLAASAGGSVALVFAAAGMLRRLPTRWINIPNRDYWLATDERREAAMNRIAAPMAWIGLLTAALLAVAVEFTIEANLEQTHFQNDSFILVMVGYLLLVAAITIWMVRDLAKLANAGNHG